MATALYVVAIVGRTSFGVAGVEAIDRFHIDASRLAVFTAVQVGAYALAQIPAGMLIDRIGPRRCLVYGALVMAAGQLILALATSYPIAIAARIPIGAGDATAFLSVMRLLPFWFDMRRTPLMSQLTAALGQSGQFFSAVPFLALLHATGWTAAFATLAGVGALVGVLAWVAVRDTPAGTLTVEPTPILGRLRKVISHPACWQGFFTHWVGLMSMGTFTLLWGMPLMNLGQGFTPAQASSVLVAFTIASVLTGPFMGILSARLGSNRFVAAISLPTVMTAGWIWFFAADTPRGITATTVLIVVVAVLTPVANTGFDTVREQVDRSVIAAATGLANMGGFTATMLAAQGIGLLLDISAEGRDYTWADFRMAFIAMGAVWALGMCGLVAATVRARSTHRRQATVLEP
ncbi:MFS transporter [Corynebacterium sp. TAE3-ERU12]|nr:MFS transporter [Corynebacterium sp. TAE3-ERU12]MBV7295821.1 MFS transporter [Corynebacterium sp. TAE3-ERU12]